MMKLIPMTEDKNWTRETRILDSGIVLNSPTHLDGGGIEMKDDLIAAILKTGKPVYERGFEWCAGFGALGFEILGKGLCKHLVVSDYYDVAIQDCFETATNNNIRDKITGYISHSIENIPESEMWDLVFANPPHCPDEQESIDAMLADLPQGQIHNHLPNTLRLLIDQDWEIHKEFFSNIKKHLTTDADVYLIEANSDSEMYIRLAEEGGLRHVGTHHIGFLPYGGIYHFKPA